MGHFNRAGYKPERRVGAALLKRTPVELPLPAFCQRRGLMTATAIPDKSYTLYCSCADDCLTVTTIQLSYYWKAPNLRWVSGTGEGQEHVRLQWDFESEQWIDCIPRLEDDNINEDEEDGTPDTLDEILI